MSATATRKRPVKVVTREETAKDVVDATSTATATARELAASFISETATKDERLFEQARIAFAGIATGAKANDIAKATTDAVAETFVESDREWARNNSVTVGGAKVSRVTITQRADAYSSILSAGIAEPTMDLVTTAFRAFTSKGAPGLADAHKKLIKETFKLSEEERAAHYIENARVVSATVTARKKDEAAKAHSEKAATASADKKSEAPVSEAANLLDTPLALLDFIRGELSRDWSEGDRAEIMAGLSEIISA